MNYIFLSIAISSVLSLIIAPFIIKTMKKMQAKQTILHYVEAHKTKEGTPTIGGVIFLFGIVITCLFLFQGDHHLALVSIAVMLGYGFLGFLDDFLKIKFKQNLGLRAYQKALGQLGIALIVSFFAYNSGLVGSEIYIPFVDKYVDLGIWFIPFSIFVFLAITNSVNLTDGLDGLVGWTSLVFFVSFGVYLVLFLELQTSMGQSLLVQSELKNLIILTFSAIGGLLGFLAFNSYPAKIFMGDTGSLALGGLISAITLFTKNMLLVPLLYTVIVVSAVSVIMQVLHFKRTKKRIFLMAPYHHHLEKKGWNETKIVAIYIIVTIVLNAFVLSFITL